MSVELTLEEYKERDKELFKKYFEYREKLANINKQEKQFIFNIKGKTYDEKSDKYFENECYKPIVDMFKRMRELLKKKYTGFTSIYEADFYTELTEEAIERLGLDEVNAPKILEEVRQRKGQRCYLHKDHNSVYTLSRAVVAPDDYYYALIDKDGKEVFSTCVGIPEWIEGEE